MGTIDANARDIGVQDAEIMLFSMSLHSPIITHVGDVDNKFPTPPPTPLHTNKKRVYDDMKEEGCVVGQSLKRVKGWKSFKPIPFPDNMPHLSLPGGSVIKKQQSERRVCFGQTTNIPRPGNA